MSTSTFTGTKQSTYLDAPEINPLDLEHICSWFEATQEKMLTDAEKAQIRKSLTEEETLEVLAELISHFITLKNSFNSMAGLTNEQIDKLKSLINVRKEFKQAREKERLKMSAYERFLENEKKILPLEQIIKWWSNNSDSLRKQSVWNDIANLIPNNSHQQEMQKKLILIKQQWARQHVFACYSSHNLMTFYKEYLCVLEKSLAERLQTKKTWPTVVCEYIKFILIQVRTLKKQAVYSMLTRLNCVEYYKSMTCDDLLLYTCQKIESECSVIVLQSDKSQDPRQGMTPELIAEYCTMIQSYCDNTPDSTDLCKEFNNLKMRTTSNSLANGLHPAVTYFLNVFDEIYETALRESNAAKTILNAKLQHDNRSNLSKLKELIDNISSISTQVAGTGMSKTYKDAMNFIGESKRKYRDHITNISISMSSIVRSKLEELIDDILNLKNVSDDQIHTVLNQIENARQFYKTHLNQDYFAQGDIILSLATKLRNMLARNQDISLAHCQAMLKFILSSHTFIRSEQIGQYRELFKKLPETIKKIKDAHQNQILHFLVHTIEIPLLNGDQINQSLQRHKHIAKLENESWEENQSDNSHINLHLTYVRNVCLNMLKTCPLITLENFDTNIDCHMLESITDEIYIDSLHDEYHSINSRSHQNELAMIKSKIQESILKKINDSFILKSYLYDENNHTIDIEKLKSFTTRVEKFFANPTHKKMIKDTLSASCLDLMKNYFLSIIENKKEINLGYVNQIREFMGETLFAHICEDNAIRSTLKGFVQTYNGTDSTLSQLFIHITPQSHLCDCEKLIHTYAAKRMEYIVASSEMTITTDDYDFFYHYIKLPFFTDLLSKNATKFQAKISDIIKNSATAWNEKSARLIELFADEQSVYNYRTKRLFEIINQKLDKNARTHFFATINPHRPGNNKIIPDQFETPLRKTIDSITDKGDWSLLNEEITMKVGTREQLQRLHFNHISKSINNISPLTEEWFTTRINQTSRMAGSDYQYFTLDNEINKLFFIEFLGEHYTSLTCQKLDQLIAKIAAADLQLNNNQLSGDDHANLIRIIATIKPFASLYSSCGTIPHHKEIIQRLADIEKKISLHFDLNVIIRQHTKVMSVAKDHPTLHNLILSLIKAVREIENTHILSETNIDQYVAFCDTEILSNIKNVLNQQQLKLDYSSLSILSNLVHYLTSEQLKVLLMNAHKNDAAENPLWLSLINHIGDESIINDINTAAKSPDCIYQISPIFQNTINFAKHLSAIKHQTNHMIKLAILNEASIVESLLDGKRISDFLFSDKPSDTQLLTLWSVCAAKLKSGQLHETANLSYAYFLISFLTKISNAILDRSKTKPELLQKFADTLNQVPEIRATLKNIFDSRHPYKNSGRHSSIWAETLDSTLLLTPINTITDTSCARQLLYIIEKYAAKKLHKDKIDSYKLFCNDPFFKDQATTDDFKHLKIKLSFDINDDTNATKILNSIKLYQHIHSVDEGKSQIESLNDLLTKLQNDLKTNTKLSHSKSYITLLKEIQSMLATYIASKNDNEFASKQNKKYNLKLITGSKSRSTSK